MGLSSISFFCATTPIIRLPAYASLINLIDLSRPAVIGITTPGNKTVFRSGNIGNDSGSFSLNISSSSSEDNNGINSASESNSCADKLSIVMML